MVMYQFMSNPIRCTAVCVCALAAFFASQGGAEAKELKKDDIINITPLKPSVPAQRKPIIFFPPEGKKIKPNSPFIVFGGKPNKNIEVKASYGAEPSKIEAEAKFTTVTANAWFLTIKAPEAGTKFDLAVDIGGKIITPSVETRSAKAQQQLERSAEPADTRGTIDAPIAGGGSQLTSSNVYAYGTCTPPNFNLITALTLPNSSTVEYVNDQIYVDQQNETWASTFPLVAADTYDLYLAKWDGTQWIVDAFVRGVVIGAR